MKKNILITGGAGFIGSHLVKFFVKKYPNYNIINLDALTYAGNLENLIEIENYPNYNFKKGDIANHVKVEMIFNEYDINHVIHLAAESHVDRSIEDPFIFAKTNVLGTLSLLEASKKYWKNNFNNKLFYHVSTDEVYGSLGASGYFTEDSRYDPHSPYSASKASSDHFVRSFNNTYNLPCLISNCSNNYGAYQFPEKLIPLFINNIIENKTLPVYGNGQNVRDWLYVNDHIDAIDTIFHNGKVGETYNIGGFNEWKNIDLINIIIETADNFLGRKVGSSTNLIRFVKDRSGHDFRYAIDANKLKNELGWNPSLQFHEGIEKTVKWYIENQDWMKRVKSGDYKDYYLNKYNKKT